MDDTGEHRSVGVSAAAHSSGSAPTTSGAEPRVTVCADEVAVARAAAEEFVRIGRESIARDGAFRVALSGGTTPLLLYRLLAGDEFRGRVNWNAVQFFWGDERAVPPGHPESNYGMAQRGLLARIAVPAQNIHRMEAEHADIEQAARDYENILRRVLPLDSSGLPRFDLILLGLGHDGHTASLFPSSRDWREYRGWVAAPGEEVAGVRRMTLTLPVLNAARHVVFLVTSTGKAEILRRVVKDCDATLPAQCVRPVDGELLFIVDKAAAARLESQHK